MDSDSADERNVVMVDKEVQGAKIYVKGFTESETKEDFEEVFGRIGKIRGVWIACGPSPYAFVEFYDQRDADKAVEQFNGENILGGKLLVELSRRESRSYRSRGSRGGYFRSRGGRFSNYRGGRGASNFGRSFSNGSSNWRGGRPVRNRNFGSRGFSDNRSINDDFKRNASEGRSGREKDYDRRYERGRQYEKNPNYNRFDRPEFFEMNSGINHSDDSGFHSNSRYRSRSPSSRFRKYSNSNYNSRESNFASNRGSGRNYYNYEKPATDRPRTFGTAKEFHSRNNSSFERRMSSSRMRY